MPYPVASARGTVFQQAAAAAFVGAYDSIPSITAAYGMRRLLTSYTGSLLRMREDGGDTEQDIGYDANGDLDTAAVSTFLSGANGYIVTWYDQSGNGYDATQATTSKQPQYVASGQNGLPVILFGASEYELSITISNGASDYSFCGVWKFDTLPGGDSNHIFDTTSGRMAWGQNSGAWGWYDGAWRTVGTASTANYVVGTYMMHTGAASLYINGASQGSITYTQKGMGGATVLGDSAPSNGNRMNGKLAEVIIANAAWSTANRQAAESAANDYWAVY